MSKQSKAKEAQCYTAKAVPALCSNCKFFRFDRVQTHEPTSWNPEGWFKDKNLRCSIGGFKVMNKGTCRRHEFK